MIYGQHYEQFSWANKQPELCGNCRKPSDELVFLPNGWNFKACAECAEWCRAVETAEPCPDLHGAIVTAKNIDEVRMAMRAHQGAECVHCGSTMKTVIEDRLALGSKEAACYEATSRKEVA